MSNYLNQLQEINESPSTMLPYDYAYFQQVTQRAGWTFLRAERYRGRSDIVRVTFRQPGGGWGDIRVDFRVDNNTLEAIRLHEALSRGAASRVYADPSMFGSGSRGW